MFRLDIQNRIGAGFCYLCSYIRALLVNDVAENLASKLLRLVMANDTDLDALFVAKILVVVHLARDKGVGAKTDSVRQQEVTSAATERHLLDRASQQFVAQCALHAELSFHHEDKVVSSHGLRQETNDTTASLDVTYLLLSKELALLQSQSLSNLPVDTILGIVHIGMHGDDDDVVLQGLDNATLHIVSTTDLFQATEQQRMMADDEVTAFAESLIDNLFVDVQTQ